MASVHFSSNTNSTFFTNCCNVAICNDQRNCPKCGVEVPGTYQERWRQAKITTPPDDD